MNGYKYPVARCPKCGRAIIYSDNPKDKAEIVLREVTADYHGRAVLCAKCKTMLALVEKPKAANGFVAIPIID